MELIKIIALAGLALLALHLPIFYWALWGTEEEKEDIRNYHPPGHE